MKMSAALVAAATAAVLSASSAFAESTQPISAAAGAGAAVSVSAGKMIYGSNGKRLGTVYRVTAQGNPQLILDGKLITLPASSLSSVDGKVMTSMSRADIDRAH